MSQIYSLPLVLAAAEPSGVVLIVIAILCVLAMHIRKPIDQRHDPTV